MYVIRLELYGEPGYRYFVSKNRTTNDLQKARIFNEEARAKRIAAWCFNQIPGCSSVEVGEVSIQ